MPTSWSRSKMHGSTASRWLLLEAGHRAVVGRSLEAKRELYRSIVQNLRAFGVLPEEVKIVLLQVSSENVGFRGGQAACDVDLGYVVNV